MIIGNCPRMANFNEVVVLLLFPFELLYLFLYAIFIRFRDLFRLIFPGPPRSIRDEIILVTGGACGIGRAICQEIAKREKQLTIVIWDVNEKAISEAASELKSVGVKNVFVSRVDVSDRLQVAAAANKIREKIGDVSILFNNAGIAGNGTDGWRQDPKVFEKVFAVNMLAHYWTVQEFLPKMIENGRGNIVATCSVLGFLPSSVGSAYGASKFAVRGFMENLKENVRHLPGKPQISFSTVYPGLVETDMTAVFDLELRRYKFLNFKMTPKFVAEKIMEGVLHGKEHIYVPGSNRLLHFMLDIHPPEFARKLYDLVGRPTGSKAITKQRMEACTGAEP